ncbi:putative heterokaryon incompatibility protein [Neofusicoccum parvum UCRNP2]|uniref:Putative heterokaryon incompatibility protein n=1 Tax=Botryosphaeria parva (strain UCR-NP2) TaxID=1287680 RepID=R1GEH9_BOTPV|nr:putative heterokaryon incompatibility protein [Neofusicoccum parvum UCRNP2]
MKSTEPRDKVFSLLNVDQEFRSREGSSGELVTHDRATSVRERRHYPKIDYATKSDEDVCVEVAQYWLASMSERGGNQLVFLQHVQERHRGADWPSWLPDWSAEHRAGKLCAAPHHNGGRSFSAAGKSQAAASISFVDAGHRERPILRACGVRFRRLEIVDVEVLPHNGDMVNGMLAGVKDRAYPGSNVSYQDAVNELADLVMAPYVDGAPYEPAKKHTHDRILARVGKKMSGSKFDLSGLTSSSAYRDASGFTRKFFLSRSGYIGLAPLRAEKRDEICILFGAKTPMAIRNKGEYYEFIGECLILGVMEGELMKNLNGDYIENLEFR